MPMTNAPVKILDWGRLYQDALTREILRSERKRVTILAGLFAFAACVYTFFAFVPGLLGPEFRVRFQAQWPWIISLHGAVVAYEWALRAGIGWLIEHRRQPHVAFRFLNALVETSIPTALLFMAVSFLGPRDALAPRRSCFISFLSCSRFFNWTRGSASSSAWSRPWKILFLHTL